MAPSATFVSASTRIVTTAPPSTLAVRKMSAPTGSTSSITAGKAPGVAREQSSSSDRIPMAVGPSSQEPCAGRGSSIGIGPTKRRPPPAVSIRPSRMFIGGLPTNEATNRFAGRR